MAKMSKAQQAAIDNRREAGHLGEVWARPRTMRVMVREGWAFQKRSDGFTTGSQRGYVTRAGLIAAGVDMDALHVEALNEDRERYQGVTVQAAPHGGWHVFLPSGICVAWRTNGEHAQALAEARTHAEALAEDREMAARAIERRRAERQATFATRVVEDMESLRNA